MKENNIVFKPIGFVRHNHKEIPKHFNCSNLEGYIIIKEEFLEGLKDIKKGELIVLLFYFHKSPNFSVEFLKRIPPHENKEMGVFSICSPVRPNPLGLSIVKVIDINKNILTVKHIDMLDGTPILDIKPHVKPNFDCE